MLAATGLGSRRQIERWIRAGRIVVNGRPASLGQSISGSETILFDGKPVATDRLTDRSSHAHLIYYKPAGEVTSASDELGRATVFDGLPKVHRGRWINVGRLDIGTSGLLLFTTDGDLAHRLMHPSYEIPIMYAVRVLGEIDSEQRRALTQGVKLDDGPAYFESLTQSTGEGANKWYQVTLREGRNREVRRMFEAVGVVVSRLIRIQFGPLALGKMRRGERRRLNATEVADLYRAVSLHDGD